MICQHNPKVCHSTNGNHPTICYQPSLSSVHNITLDPALRRSVTRHSNRVEFYSSVTCIVLDQLKCQILLMTITCHICWQMHHWEKKAMLTMQRDTGSSIMFWTRLYWLVHTCIADDNMDTFPSIEGEFMRCTNTANKLVLKLKCDRAWASSHWHWRATSASLYGETNKQTYKQDILLSSYLHSSAADG